MKFKINNIIDQKDGTVLLDIEVTNELRLFVRNYYKRERCTRKLISKFINEGISLYVERFGLCKK